MAGKILVKLGGGLLDDAGARAAISKQISAIHRTHPALVVVHGGGKQMTRFLAERQTPNEFIDGLRVSSPAVIDAVLKVFAGTVNHELVAAIVAAGTPAVGLTGIDAALTECEPVRPELGRVGRPVKTNPMLLDTLVTGEFLPVVACVGGARDGSIFNVNADQMASSLATGWQADTLIFLTDVDGVRGAEGNRIPVLTRQQSADLIASGVATGGMLAKLRAVDAAIEGGVREVRIALGSEPGVIERVLAGEDLGTAFR
jgi:acetylglutamate kinase